MGGGFGVFIFSCWCNTWDLIPYIYNIFCDSKKKKLTKSIYLSLEILDEDVVASFSLFWLLFFQIVDLHHCRLSQKFQRWYHIPVQYCGGAGVVLGDG